MRSPSFLLLLASVLLTSSTQAQLQWSKQNFGGSFEQTDRADFNNDGFPDLILYQEQKISSPFKSTLATARKLEALRSNYTSTVLPF
jgi:hypothetical protein